VHRLNATHSIVNLSRSTRASLHSESPGRAPSEEDGQLPRATEYCGVEIMIYSFQSWNIVEETETRV